MKPFFIFFINLFLVFAFVCVISSCTANQFYRETHADGSSTTVYNGGSVETKSDTTTHTTDITTIDDKHIHFDATTTKNDETSLSGQYFLYKGLEVTTKAAASVSNTKTKAYSAPGIIKAKGDAAVNLQNTQNAVPLAKIAKAPIP